MNNFAKRIEAECKMIAEFDQKLADIWRFLIMFGGEGFDLKEWAMFENEFTMHGLHWSLRVEENWSYCFIYLVDKYGNNYSWKSIEETKL